MNKVNHTETSNDATLANSRPLFSSAWLELFTMLREHYAERHIAVPVNSEPPQEKYEE